MELIYNSSPKYDMKVILGDLNAKLGKEAMYNRIIGGKNRHM